MQFKLTSSFNPTGDQPAAIKQLVDGIESNEKYQTLLGVTGSGKTFTVANIIQKVQRPTLVLAHNKTLAAQLYSEFKQFFPENAVEYFVSYYDYYQPEAYMPVSGTYIEKDLSINEEIEKLRLSTTSSLLSGRRDVIVIASVSCLYGIGNPVEFQKNVINLKVDEVISRTNLLHKLVQSLYSRTEGEFNHGNFRIKGDTVDVFPSYADYGFRIHFFGDEIEAIESFDVNTNKLIEDYKTINIYPANMFVTSPDILQNAIKDIQDDLIKQHDYFKDIGKHLEAKRLKERTEFDLEMIRELGYCSGIENYSRYLDGRSPGTRPFCLLDYFPSDSLMVIDESHVTISQVHAMYGGDRSRKENLVEYGFRLPAAMDNRPLKFEEFESLQNQVLYVSATPADYELEKSDGIFVEQIIRPTGLLDPIIEVRPSLNQIDDLIEESTSNGIEQYVILGAGYDTRAHRLKLSASIKVFEVDQQEVQVRKRSKLPDKLSASENIIYVDIDLNDQSLKDRLIESGYDQSKSTVFTLEGVSQYVTKKAICSTIKELSDLSKKTNAIFYISYVSDLINKNPKACFGKGYLNPEKKVSLIKKGSAKVGEPWISFYNDEEIEKILSENGFTIMANKTLSDLNPLYFTPVDRTLPEDQIFNLEHSVVAKNSNQ